MNRNEGFNYCFRQKAEDPKVHQIYIYDDIEKYGDFDWNTWEYKESETSAKHFKELLAEIPENDPIELYINSNGGDVFQGTAIYNQLKRHPGKITAYVDGACHSIAFTIFQAADWRVMGQGTSAIIHNMWMRVAGNAKELRKAADDLDAMMDSCVKLLMSRAKNITEQELRAMLDAETVLTPEMALQYGFCDEISETKEDPDEAEDAAEVAENAAQRVFDEMRQMRQELQEAKEQIAEMAVLREPANEPEPAPVEQKTDESGKEDVIEDVKAADGFNAFFDSKESSKD